MFECFTDNARRALGLASTEAQLLNCEYIGTEHILLALVRPEMQDSDVGRVFTVLKLDRQRVREEVIEFLQRGPTIDHPEKLPFTPFAKKVLEYAQKEGIDRPPLYWVGSDDLLIGLLRQPDGVAAVVLKRHMTIESARAAASKFRKESSDERAAEVLQKIRESRKDSDIPPFDLVDLGKKGREALDALQEELNAANSTEALERALALVRGIKNNLN